MKKLAFKKSFFLVINKSKQKKMLVQKKPIEIKIDDIMIIGGKESIVVEVNDNGSDIMFTLKNLVSQHEFKFSTSINSFMEFTCNTLLNDELEFSNEIEDEQERLSF